MSKKFQLYISFLCLLLQSCGAELSDMEQYIRNATRDLQDSKEYFVMVAPGYSCTGCKNLYHLERLADTSVTLIITTDRTLKNIFPDTKSPIHYDESGITDVFSREHSLSLPYLVKIVDNKVAAYKELDVKDLLLQQ